MDAQSPLYMQQSDDIDHPSYRAIMQISTATERAAGALPAADVPALSVSPIPGPVLVIDDEENVRLVAARMLERRGFAVLSAADGVTGVALYEGSAAPVAAVLLDLSMPQMSGVEVAQALCRIDPAVRIVLMSGYAEDDARRRFAEMGIAAFLQKPFTLSDLGAAMQLVLGTGL